VHALVVDGRACLERCEPRQARRCGHVRTADLVELGRPRERVVVLVEAVLLQHEAVDVALARKVPDVPRPDVERVRV